MEFFAPARFLTGKTPRPVLAAHRGRAEPERHGTTSGDDKAPHATAPNPISQLQ
ncbi:MAG TPA: hypothetical protein VFS45_01680 [Sphingomicrobium sp.]|nr:hypothetical protein [Sphingomicrobium sp.]